ncbi:MAG: TauD/TfdA family dioxygenase [Methylophilaceae bacterium]
MVETKLSDLRSCLSRNSVVLVRSNSESDYMDEIHRLGSLTPMEENFSSGDKNGGLFSKIEYRPGLSESFSHSNTKQSSHTDGSYERNAPNLVFLLCRKSAQYGGHTFFLNNEVLLDLMPGDLKQDLTRMDIVHSKGTDSRERPVLMMRKGNKPSWNWNFYRAEKTPENSNFIGSLKQLLEHIEC